MSLRNISKKLDLKETVLKKHLKLLQDSSLVIKENFGKNKIFFALTKNGPAVLKILTDIYPNQEIDFKSMAIQL